MKNLTSFFFSFDTIATRLFPPIVFANSFTGNETLFQLEQAWGLKHLEAIEFLRIPSCSQVFGSFIPAILKVYVKLIETSLGGL